MKIFSAEKIHEIDAYTIKHEPVASVDLMERASRQVCNWIAGNFDRSCGFIVFAGPGNNGGDGLAIARILSELRYNVKVYYVKFSDKTSEDWEINRKRLEEETVVKIIYLSGADQFPLFSDSDIVIDAIFGTGLTSPVQGFPAEIIMKINNSGSTIISIDIPSGLFSEDNSSNAAESVIRADYTLSFQFPKLSFMFAENDCFAGNWLVLPIDLDKKAIQNTLTHYNLTELSDILPMIRKRNKFDHKGKYGHGLIVSGSKGKIGAAALSAKAALRTGIGLVTCHIPSCGYSVIQTSLPEAIVISDRSENFVSDINQEGDFNAVAIGPGIGIAHETQKAFDKFLSNSNIPLVLDADALNILALDKHLLQKMPEKTIITPHLKEFERIAGKSVSGYERLQKQIEFSKRYNCIVILKGAHTSVATPLGEVWFNNTGNPGMATAGSGDVLTGILLSLLAQGYSPENAAIFGVFLHGTAGDLASSTESVESMIASDIINCIGKAFNNISNNKH